jgi:hypothetical protein
VFEDMNTSQIRIPAAIFTVNEDEVTLFDILDTFQKTEELRGQDFGTFVLRASNGSLNCFNKETYEPVWEIAKEEFSPESERTFGNFSRFNQFIRNVQLTFPGHSFQELVVGIRHGKIHIAVRK